MPRANISSRGLMAESPAPPRIGEKIALEICEVQRLSATVVWVRQEMFGASFGSARDLAQLLRRERLPEGRKSRPPRFECQGHGTLRIASQHHFVSVANVSQTGMRVALDGLLALGGQVSCDIEGLGRVRGVVRWARSGEAGISFDEPLSYDLLAHWIWLLNREHRLSDCGA